MKIPQMIEMAKALNAEYKGRLWNKNHGMDAALAEPSGLIERMRWSMGEWALAAAGVRLTEQVIDLLERSDAAADVRAEIYSGMMQYITDMVDAHRKTAHEALIMAAYSQAAKQIIDTLLQLPAGRLASTQIGEMIITGIDRDAAARKAASDALIDKVEVVRMSEGHAMRGYWLLPTTAGGLAIQSEKLDASTKREAMKEAKGWIEARDVTHKDVTAHLLAVGPTAA